MILKSRQTKQVSKRHKLHIKLRASTQARNLLQQTAFLYSPYWNEHTSQNVNTFTAI